MNYTKSVLPNGLRLITVPMPHVQSATVLILVGAGSRYETKQISGLSHFLEHMAFKGTKKRPNALTIATEIESLGAEFNAFTSKDHTGYYIKAAKQHLPQILDVLSDMLLNSKFDEKEIEREKGVIIEEINLYEDTPSRKIGEIYEELLYGDTPLGWDIAGQAQIIRKIKRQDFLDYTNSLYSPQNAVVVVSGGIKLDKLGQLGQLIEKSLGGWQKREIGSFDKISDKQFKPAVAVVYKKTEQAHLALGARAYNLSHPDRYVLGILGAILGGGMSSRLFIEVRERRGLAYYVHSGGESYADVGHFVTLAGVDLHKIDEAIRVILDEYEKVTNKQSFSANGINLTNVTNGELTKAKEFLKGRLILDLEDSKSVAGLFGQSELLEKKIKTPEEIMEKIDKVSLDDLERVAKDIFKREKLNLAVIGPFEDKDKFEKLLL